jgi:tRNA pseudouridine38-40 synthase
MPRYKILIEYDGTPYAGWQRQKNAPSVQQALEAAIKRFTGEDVLTFGAGRTDSGVHATGQVDDSFDARYSAVKRHYVYRVIDRRAPAALEINRVWDVRKHLDIDAMQAAANSLLGWNDFTTFRSTDCQALSPMKTLDRLDVRREGDQILFEVSSRSFLHNQVRSMVGTLKKVGEGSWPVARVAEVLEARDRKACGPVAPAGGLYLVRVDYASGAEQPAEDTAEDEA